MPDKLLERLSELPAIGWVENLHRVEEPRLFENRAFVRECLEAVVAVVATETAVVAAAERELRVHKLHEAVVDRRTARCGVAYHVFNCAFRRRENIERQWLFAAANVFECLIKMTVSDNWQDRPENFFFENAAAFGDIGDN